MPLTRHRTKASSMRAREKNSIGQGQYCFLPLPFLSCECVYVCACYLWDCPGLARPTRHLLHNVTGWNPKSFISTHCLSSESALCVRCVYLGRTVSIHWCYLSTFLWHHHSCSVSSLSGMSLS